MIMSAARWLSGVLLAGLLTGCAGYRLGPTNAQTAGARSVQINPVVNQTVEPRLAEAVTAALRKQFQRDATYRVATRNDGDILVTGVITRYDRRELSFLPDDVLTVQDYQVSMTAQITARERSSGRVLLDQPVTGRSLLRVGTDLASAERQMLPLMAEDLAKNVVALLAEGPW
jgi:hypothetical protein